MPPDDERSNFRLARETLLERLDKPPAHVHRMRGEIDPDRAAHEYDGLLRGIALHVVLLGVGADGHTASLFPGSAALDERERLALAVDGADVRRVTLTPPALEAAPLVVFLVAGADKAEAAARRIRRASRPGHAGEHDPLGDRPHGRSARSRGRVAAGLSALEVADHGSRVVSLVRQCLQKT